MIQYGLYPAPNGNTLSNTYHARAITPPSKGMDEVVNRMLEGGSTVTKSDIYAVLNDLKRSIQNIILDGGRVNIEGFCQFYPVFQGVFEDQHDSFDPARHRVEVGATPSQEFKEVVSRAKVGKTKKVKNIPELETFIDVKTGEKNSKIYPATIGVLKGKNLKMDLEKEDEGLFLQNMADQSFIKLDTLSKNTSTELNFLCPFGISENMPYRFELRNRNYSTNPLRTTRMSIELTGAA
ncbi:MAG: DUF4469 domain-containing protein [Leptospiraceae bacterium]|nr:DUF4469 domain-containing protein [Leptospiraceae bacterium]